jgi:hypothetical protein
VSEVVESEVISTADLPKEPGVSNLVLKRPPDMDVMAQLGFITPIATPEQLRAAFAYAHSMFAAILDKTDYLYVITWQNGDKKAQKVTTSHEEAVEVTAKWAHLKSVMSAKPKKSGIVKLARALGISAKRKLSAGLPDEPTAQYAYVEYEALHEATGKVETGIGWCEKAEKGGKTSTHDVITTADTRAYNRAVLRLAGFGDVSADEIVAGGLGDEESVDEIPQQPRQKELKPLHDLTDEDVVGAASAWARAIVRRKEKNSLTDYFDPRAKQDTREARELRAQARRGIARSAEQLGSLGLDWSGTASDGLGYPTFDTGLPPVTPRDIERSQDAARTAEQEQLMKGLGGEDTTRQEDPASATQSDGWDLSGSKADDESTAPEGESAGEIPSPSPNSETITLKQAKNVSLLLKEIFSEKSDMQSWLFKNCHARKTVDIHTNQYEPIIAALKKKKESING